jgi:hypothetical protein
VGVSQQLPALGIILYIFDFNDISGVFPHLSYVRHYLMYSVFVSQAVSEIGSPSDCIDRLYLLLIQFITVFAGY